MRPEPPPAGSPAWHRRGLLAFASGRVSLPLCPGPPQSFAALSHCVLVGVTPTVRQADTSPVTLFLLQEQLTMPARMQGGSFRNRTEVESTPCPGRRENRSYGPGAPCQPGPVVTTDVPPGMGVCGTRGCTLGGCRAGGQGSSRAKFWEHRLLAGPDVPSSSLRLFLPIRVAGESTAV